jgi:hypothetical protein
MKDKEFSKIPKYSGGLVKFKYWFFNNYWWLFILVFVVLSILAVSVIEITRLWEIVAGIYAILVSAFFFVQKQRIEELRIFKELFTEFNNRYDNLNDPLNKIIDGNPNEELTQNEKIILFDYFNLCGEEYFFYKQRHIHPDVWKSWLNGMQLYYNKPRIGKLWIDELGQNSYYGFSTNLFD